MKNLYYRIIAYGNVHINIKNENLNINFKGDTFLTNEQASGDGGEENSLERHEKESK